MLVRKKNDNKASVTESSIKFAKHAIRKNCCLNKSEFKDGLHLICGWQSPNTPQICPCGQSFTLTHSLHCPKSGYNYLRHNENRDTFAKLQDDLCHDVEIEEPKLHSLEGEIFHNKTTLTEDDARLDIKANELWGGQFRRTFFDVKIFNPHAKSRPKTISDAYKDHEKVKTFKYQQRILDMENSSFVQICFSCTGGAAPGSTKTIQKLAEKLSEKRNESFSDTINFKRTEISFALLRSAIFCLMG